MGDKTFSLLDFSDAVRAAAPEFAKRLPTRTVPDWMVRVFAFVDKDIRGNVGELGIVRLVDSSEVEKLLGRKLIPTADAVAATAKSLIEQGVVKRP